MPKYFIQESFLSTLPWILRVTWWLSFSWGGWNFTKLDFSIFRESLLQISQALTALRWLFVVISRAERLIYFVLFFTALWLFLIKAFINELPWLIGFVCYLHREVLFGVLSRTCEVRLVSICPQHDLLPAELSHLLMITIGCKCKRLIVYI